MGIVARATSLWSSSAPRAGSPCHGREFTMTRAATILQRANSRTSTDSAVSVLGQLAIPALPPADPVESAKAVGLNYVSDESPGFTRRRSGKGFVYLDEHGKPLTDPEHLARIRALVIPPAWEDVWICPSPRGHILRPASAPLQRQQVRARRLLRRLALGAGEGPHLRDNGLPGPHAHRQPA